LNEVKQFFLKPEKIKRSFHLIGRRLEYKRKPPLVHSFYIRKLAILGTRTMIIVFAVYGKVLKRKTSYALYYDYFTYIDVRLFRKTVRKNFRKLRRKDKI